MRKSGRFGHLLGITLAASLIPSIAAAQDSNDEFSRYMLEGVRYFKDGSSDPANYKKAIEAFEAARKIEDIPDINYNIGRCHHMLGNCQQAAEYYQKYASVSEANAEVVKKYVDALNQECDTGTLTVVCSSTPAKVKIDALPSLQCGDETKSISLAPGSHTVVVSADGIDPQTQLVTVKPKENAVASFWLPVAQTQPVAQPQYETAPRQIAGDTAAAPASTSVAATTTAPAEPATVTTTPDAAADTTAADDDGKPSIWFWTGVGAAGTGILFSIIGGAVLGSSFEEFTFSTGRKTDPITAYERDKSKYVGGQAVLGIGISLTIVGATLIVLDKFVFSKKSDSTTAQVAPVINVSPDLATAGVAVSF